MTAGVSEAGRFGPTEPSWSASFLTSVAWGSLIFLIYVFLLGPVLLVVVNSFNDSLTSTFPPDSYSLRWYWDFLDNRSFTDAFQFSLLLATGTAILSSFIGFLAAYSIARAGRLGRNLRQSFSLLPVMVPNALIGMSLLLALTVVPLPEYAALLAGHVVISLPFAVAAILSSFGGVDEELEQAARTLGASRLRVAFEIVMPLVSPGLVSGALFAFIVSFGDVYISLFLAAPGRVTLPIEIFLFMQWESTPVIAAITTVQMAMILVIGLLVERLIGLKKILRIRD